MNSRNPQLNENGALQHLLTTEGLPVSVLLHILDTAESFVGVTERDVKKIPLLRGKSIFNLFLNQARAHARLLRLPQSDYLPTSLISILQFLRNPKERRCLIPSIICQL